MQYCRLQTTEGPQYAQVEDRSGEPWIARLIPSPWTDSPEAVSTSFTPGPLSDAQLLPPASPSKIICVGRNYRDHAKELGNEVPTQPLLFFKPPSSLLAPGGTILLPPAAERVDFEGELAILIAKRARHLSQTDDLAPYIHGYTLANDVTARDLQKKDGQWARAKGFDTFCPLGPIVNTDLDPANLTLETHLNGELRQHGSTADFIFTLPVLFEFITSFMTLEPGDLLLTGTPAGVGPLAPGDTVSVTVTGLGTLTNPVSAEPIRP